MKEPETIVTQTSIRLRIDGTPVQQGSMNAYIRGGKAILVHAKNKALTLWRDKITRQTRAEAVRAGWALPLDEPINVFVVFYMPRPKTVKRALPSTKPDLDKLLRAVGDGLGNGIVKDDSRIVGWYVEQFYDDDGQGPRIEMRITREPGLKPSIGIWTDQTVPF